MSPKHKRFTTVYQRAKVKAQRLHWQSVKETGVVPVAELLAVPGILGSDGNLKGTKGSVLKKENTGPLCSGYPFCRTSKRKSKQGYTISFKFYSPKASSEFVVKAFYFDKVDLFMVKFFNKSSKSLNKYAVRTNRGDVRAILRTNFDILIYLSRAQPNASFGFMGERSFFTDKSTHRTLIEPMADNQRFRIYHLFLHQPDCFGWLTMRFELRYIKKLSTCLLINKSNTGAHGTKIKEKQLIDFFGRAYPQLNFSDL